MKQRVDVALVERGLAETRQKAQALVMAGPEHVGRGALKLVGALDMFGIDPAGRVAVDLGASTGGFTEVLLARGARRVYAVDVGKGQLHERLRADPRVVVRDKVNARHLGAEDVPEPCTLATVDVSFISVAKVLPALRGVLAEGADTVVLVKPQFEVGRGQVGRGGIVTDSAQHAQALRAVAEAAQREAAFGVRAACASPVTGAEGNREFFLHLVAGAPAMAEADVTERVAAAVQPLTVDA
jgi:23S rRNA (cytidine1920-2'-O)/16S rRNA (cytidine1409-2'-O)-methyltransferase